MTCEEIDELLAAYSIGALDSDETRAVNEHLATCRRHDEALAGYVGVAARLPVAVEEREPPAELRARIMSAFESEAGAAAAGTPSPRLPAPPSPSTTLRAGLGEGEGQGGSVVRAIRWPRLVFKPAWGLAAAAAVVAAGLVAWGAVTLTSDGGDGAERFVVTDPAGRGELVYFEGEARAELELDLPELPERRVYQAWRIEGETPESLGVVAGDGATAFEEDVSDADAVAVSVEPAGGSEQPTTQPLLVLAIVAGR